MGGHSPIAPAIIEISGAEINNKKQAVWLNGRASDYD